MPSDLKPHLSVVEMKWTRDIEHQQDSFQALELALATALILVMVVLYDRFIYRSVVLFSVPVALVGALIALNLAMNTLSILC